jgi:hypothetical protein
MSTHIVARFGQSYFEAAFEADLVVKARECLRGVRFDTFVGSGLSGTIAATILGRAMRKHFAIVRKSTGDCHSSSMVEGNLGERWIFVDDLVSTGRTRARCIEEVEKAIRQYNRDERSVDHNNAKRYKRYYGYLPEWLSPSGEIPPIKPELRSVMVGTFVYNGHGHFGAGQDWFGTTE